MPFIMFAYICRQYDFDAANIQKKLINAKKILPRLCNQAEVADLHGVQLLEKNRLRHERFEVTDCWALIHF